MLLGWTSDFKVEHEGNVILRNVNEILPNYGVIYSLIDQLEWYTVLIELVNVSE
jgi:hypothetical protein